ncbi:MAG: hypothetical protein WHT46_09530, partial [Candidatus Geothermincolales bacterium]
SSPSSPGSWRTGTRSPWDCSDWCSAPEAEGRGTEEDLEPRAVDLWRPRAPWRGVQSRDDRRPLIHRNVPSRARDPFPLDS